jgi:hypothetical protein
VGTRTSRFAERFAVVLAPASQPRYRDTALADTKAVLKHRMIVATGSLVALAGGIVTAVESELSIGVKIGIVVVGSSVGAAALLGPVVLCGALVCAPYRQRNQARQELAALALVRSRPDAFTSELADWLLAKKAALPGRTNTAGEVMTHLHHTIGMNREDRARADHELSQRQDAPRRQVEAVNIRARTEYHERFRRRALELLPAQAQPLANAPQSLGDLEEILDALRRVDPEEKPKVEVPLEHREQLRKLLTVATEAVENDRDNRYDEVPGLSHTNRDMFRAHFPKLAERLASWDQALFDRDGPVGSLRGRILRESQARGFNDPPYRENNVMSLATTVTLDRIHKSVPVQQLPSMVRWQRWVTGFRPTLHWKDMPIASADQEDEKVLDNAESAVMGFVDEIQSWGEVKGITKAERQYLRNADKQDLLSDLRKHSLLARLFEVEDCEICRGNRGHLD